jgi:hypothetical protein
MIHTNNPIILTLGKNPVTPYENTKNTFPNFFMIQCSSWQILHVFYIEAATIMPPVTAGMNKSLKLNWCPKKTIFTHWIHIYPQSLKSTAILVILAAFEAARTYSSIPKSTCVCLHSNLQQIKTVFPTTKNTKYGTKYKKTYTTFNHSE